MKSDLNLLISGDNVGNKLCLKFKKIKIQRRPHRPGSSVQRATEKLLRMKLAAIKRIYNSEIYGCPVYNIVSDEN